MSNKTHKDTETVVIFDIGSASVGGAIVLFKKNEKPRILYNVRKQMAFHDSLNTEKFTDSMLRSLSLVLFDIGKQGLIHLNFLKIEDKEITKSFCFFSSPWHVSQTKSIIINKDKNFFVTEELINSIVKKEEDDFILEKQKNKELGELELIDKKIIQIKLNGYRVDNPFKKKARILETSIFMSLISSELLEEIKKRITKHFYLNEFYSYSFTFSTFLSLRDIFHFEQDFILVDLSGEVTDVSFVKDGVLIEIETFPIGRNSFIREVAKGFNLNFDSAFSLLKNYVDGGVDEKTMLKFEKILEQTKKEWLRFFENSILDLSKGTVLPRSLFIVANPTLGEILKTFIKSELFTKLIFPDYNETVNPVLINHSEISNFCDFGKAKEKDVFLAIETIFINKLI